MNDKQLKVLEKITQPLRDALIKYEVTEDSVVKVFAGILTNEKGRDADRLRAVEIFSRWSGLAQPEEKIIKVSGIKIGVEEDGTDI